MSRAVRVRRSSVWGTAGLARVHVPSGSPPRRAATPRRLQKALPALTGMGRVRSRDPKGARVRLWAGVCMLTK